MSSKVVVGLLLAACFSCYAAAVTCNKLLNCKDCEDELHCKSCPEGYNLDSNKVCRLDCAAKYGENCTSCTDSKCICGAGEEWNSTTGKCVLTECTSADGSACEFCGKGFDLVDVNGKCTTCAEVFGAGCSSCNWARCLTVKSGYTLCGAVTVNTAGNEKCPDTCEKLFPGCSKCDENKTKCETCATGAELQNGACKLSTTCPAGQKALLIGGKITCGACSAFDANCVALSCNAHGCTRCKTGFAVSHEGGCIECAKAYPGCGLCNADSCTRCKSSQWVLTPNGCVNQVIFVSEPEESNGGMIAGIVIACLVLVVLIVLAVYCVITSTSKKGVVDTAVYEEDLEFKSMSVL